MAACEARLAAISCNLPIGTKQELLTVCFTGLTTALINALAQRG